MAQNFIAAADSARIFRKLKSNPANKVCFDCPAKNPNWTSIPFGVYLCMNCSATHRRMGVHITFVKSSILDKWNREHIAFMVAGGNQNAREFFKQRGFNFRAAIEGKEKYTSRIAKLYKQQLAKKARSAMHDVDAMLSAKSPVVAPKPTKAIDGDFGLDSLISSFAATPGKSKKKKNLTRSTGNTPVASTASAFDLPNRSPSPPPVTEVEKPADDLLEEEEEEAKDAAHDALVARVAHEPKRVVIHAKKPKETEERATLVRVGRSSVRRKKKKSLLSTRKSKPTPVSSVTVSDSVDGLDDLLNDFSAPKKVNIKGVGSSKSSHSADVPETDARTNNDNDSANPTTNVTNGHSAKPTKPRASSPPKRKKLDIWGGAAVKKPAEKRSSRDKYKNAKSISSDQVFGRAEYAPPTEEERQRRAQLKGAKGFGSDAYFGRRTEPVDEDSIDVGQVGEQLAQGASQLKQYASDFFSNLSRYG